MKHVRFQCLGVECDRCCYGSTPYGSSVRMTPEDWLNMGEDAARITIKRMRFDPGEPPVADPFNGEMAMFVEAGERCAFWKEGVGCSIYDRRPKQCRLYPLDWPALRDPEAWEAEKERCPGIGQGPKIKLHKIKGG